MFSYQIIGKETQNYYENENRQTPFYSKTTNHETIKVFVHEMFHAMSWHYGAFGQHSGMKNSVEESMAQEFTIYLGLGR